jgi:hypothetical protein
MAIPAFILAFLVVAAAAAAIGTNGTFPENPYEIQMRTMMGLLAQDMAWLFLQSVPHI